MQNEETIINPEIVEDMPDFEEEAVNEAVESEESVIECTADTENANVSEEKEGETKEKAEKKPKEQKISAYEQAILSEMERRAKDGDELLATALRSKDKNIQGCFSYVKAQARKKAVNGCAMIEDSVVYGWSHHYYIEPKEVIDKELAPKSAPKADTATKPTTPAKADKKAKEKEKPVKNVLDITKAIVSATGDKKRKKKDSLKAGFVPMERPDTLKDAKKGSRQQAKSVEQMDLFADFFAE